MLMPPTATKTTITITTLSVYLYNVVILLLFACAYYFFAKWYGTEDDKQNFDSFEDSLYYTTITHFTIGFGDIAPQSPALRRLTMLQVIISFYLLKVTLSRHI